jgi:hypothetical protein
MLSRRGPIRQPSPSLHGGRPSEMTSDTPLEDGSPACGEGREQHEEDDRYTRNAVIRSTAPEPQKKRLLG